MALATKGQVTIPKKIRESLIKPIAKKVDDFFYKLHKPGREAVSLEKINDAISNRMRDKYK
ncbi:MAG: AbrB family transcriptional regulator [Candidatus Electrothrix sp. ATG2]|nr:AbrB family transcriptional regulator [Candidatus Electrothrix sp. ATG2]